VTLFCDIDATICITRGADYADADPIKENIDKINKRYDSGDTIVYWTARGTTTGINWFEITLEQLKRWGAKFHELRMGKPNYDLLVCDKTKRIEEL
jgi:hypothetical protein